MPLSYCLGISKVRSQLPDRCPRCNAGWVSVHNGLCCSCIGKILRDKGQLSVEMTCPRCTTSAIHYTDLASILIHGYGDAALWKQVEAVYPDWRKDSSIPSFIEDSFLQYRTSLLANAGDHRDALPWGCWFAVAKRIGPQVMADYRSQLFFLLSTIPSQYSHTEKSRSEIADFIIETARQTRTNLLTRVFLHFKIANAVAAHDDILKQVESEYDEMMRRMTNDERLGYLSRIHKYVCARCARRLIKGERRDTPKGTHYDYEGCPRCGTSMKLGVNPYFVGACVLMPDESIEYWYGGKRVMRSMRGEQWSARISMIDRRYNWAEYCENLSCMLGFLSNHPHDLSALETTQAITNLVGPLRSEIEEWDKYRTLRSNRHVLDHLFGDKEVLDEGHLLSLLNQAKTAEIDMVRGQLDSICNTLRRVDSEETSGDL
jgi:RNase P subunit RPR2